MNLFLKKDNLGFTLIELLVVVAIIGVLASVVLASLNSARRKGNEAVIKSNLASARSQAELFFMNNNNSYRDVCEISAGGLDGIGKNLLEASKVVGLSDYVIVSDPDGEADGGQASCFSDDSTWVAEVPLSIEDGDFWCVDYTGNSKKANVSFG